MPRRTYTTIPGIITLPFGKTNNFTVYVRNGSVWTLIEGWTWLDIKIAMNQLWKTEITTYDITATVKDYVKEEGIILLFYDTTFLAKMRIKRIEYSSVYEAKIVAYSMDIDLDSKEVKTLSSAAGESKRQQYTNINTNTIISELLSVNGDGSSPWYMQAGTNTNFGQITCRFENISVRKALLAVREQIDYDIWVSQSTDYLTDSFNTDTRKGSASSVYTFNISGANANCTKTDYQKDTDNIVNFLYVQGYGDGTNQIKTSLFQNTNTYSTLSANITAAATSIDLVDASSFPSSGTIIIAEEQITYTGKSTNTLTGCTRGASSTTAKTHPKGCYVGTYINPAESNSANWLGSMLTYGRIEKTLTDKDIIDVDSLEQLGSKILLDNRVAIERIKLKPMAIKDFVQSIVLGDEVTIVDAESGINGDYKVLLIHCGVSDTEGEFIEIECSNVSLDALQDLEDVKAGTKSMAVVMQGGTTCYMTGETDNCDSTHPIRIDFFVPDEAVAVNKIKLNYKIEKYRTWSSTASAGGGSTPTTSSDTHTHSITATGAHTHATTIAAGGSHQHTCPAHQHNIGEILADWPTSGYPLSASVGKTVAAGDGETTSVATTHSHGAETSTSTTHDHTIGASGAHTHTVTIGNHTHDITYGITTDPNAWGVTDITINVDGTDRTGVIETAKGSALVVSENGTENGAHMELKTYLSTPIAGAWHYIEIQPNGNCRMQSDIFIQIFIQSRV